MQAKNTGQTVFLNSGYFPVTHPAAAINLSTPKGVHFQSVQSVLSVVKLLWLRLAAL
jgi:hypothetical protein